MPLDSNLEYDIKLLTLSPEDILVIGLNFANMSEREMQQHAIKVRDSVKKLVPNRVMITNNDTTLTILRSEE